MPPSPHSPASAKRRRLDISTASAVLARPFKTPLKSTTPRQPVSSNAETTDQSVTPASPSFEAPHPETERRSQLLTPQTDAARIRALKFEIETLTFATRLLEPKRTREDGVQRREAGGATSTGTASEEKGDVALQGLIEKWRGVSRLAAEHLFEGMRETVGPIHEVTRLSLGCAAQEDGDDTQKGFTMDVMLRGLGVDPCVIGFDVKEQQWID